MNEELGNGSLFTSQGGWLACTLTAEELEKRDKKVGDIIGS